MKYQNRYCTLQLAILAINIILLNIFTNMKQNRAKKFLSKVIRSQTKGFLYNLSNSKSYEKFEAKLKPIEAKFEADGKLIEKQQSIAKNIENGKIFRCDIREEKYGVLCNKEKCGD